MSALDDDDGDHDNDDDVDEEADDWHNAVDAFADYDKHT